jgi:hypothetical protein
VKSPEIVGEFTADAGLGARDRRGFRGEWEPIPDAFVASDTAGRVRWLYNTMPNFFI